MLIEIHCSNYSGFDAALGSYVECGHKIIVSEDQIGEFVTCPKCNQQVEIPYDAASSTVRQEPKSRPSQTKSASQSSAGTTGRVRPKKTPASGRAKQPSRTKNKQSPAVPVVEKPNQVSKASRSKDSRSKDSRSTRKTRKNSSDITKTDVMEMEFGGQQADSKLAEDRTIRCKKCGNIVEDGKCTVCHYVEPKFEKLNQPLDQIEIEITGFQRWFCRTMNEGVSLKFLEWGAHGLLGFLGAMVVFSGVLFLAGFGTGPVGGVILIALALSIGALYVGLIYKGHQFLKDPSARLAWFQNRFGIRFFVFRE